MWEGTNADNLLTLLRLPAVLCENTQRKQLADKDSKVQGDFM